MSFAGVMKRDVKTRGYEMSSDIKLFLPLNPENNLSLLPTVESKDKNLKLNFLFFFLCLQLHFRLIKNGCATSGKLLKAYGKK